MAEAQKFTFKVKTELGDKIRWVPGKHAQEHLRTLTELWGPSDVQAVGELILTGMAQQLASDLCTSVNVELGVTPDDPFAAMSARFSDDPHTSDVAETLAMFAELGIPVIEVGQMGAFDQGMSERIDDLIAQRPAAATDE